MELSQKNVNACVTRGLSVIQGDADTDLVEYPSGAFDYAILSLTLQATRDPRQVLEQMVRIGRHAIVSFPNFGHWRVRLHPLFPGSMPVTEALAAGRKSGQEGKEGVGRVDISGGRIIKKKK